MKDKIGCFCFLKLLSSKIKLKIKVLKDEVKQLNKIITCNYRLSAS